MGFCKGAVGFLWCVGEGLSCPPLCRPIPGHCRARQSGHFLETGSLHPPLAALRRFPLPRATARVAPTEGVQKARWAGRCRHRPLRKRNKRCNGRATARVAPTEALQGVRWAGRCRHRPLRMGYKGCNGRATARVAPTEGVQEVRRGIHRAKNKIVPGFCQGRCAAPWYHLASRPAHAGGLMKCRYTSALLRARPSEPKAQEALDPAAPEPCSPVRPAPAFTYSGSLGRSANGVLFPSLPF